MTRGETVDAKKAALVFGRDKPAVYCDAPPYLPGVSHPELDGRVAAGAEDNHVYEMVRSAFISLGLDHANAGTARWNPLGELINPGDKVLIKPNMVRHVHLGGGSIDTVVTHPSVVRCVADYAALALGGSGRLVIADAPVQGADFGELRRLLHLDEVVADLSATWGLEVELIDFRLSGARVGVDGCMVERVALEGDPRGYTVVNMGRESLLTPIEDDYERFRVTNYTSDEMKAHHGGGRHEYLVPNTVLESDVVLNLPKLKTHRKVGLTCCLKNLVGVNGQKDWLPHHREGSVASGGDQYLNDSLCKSVITAWHAKLDASVGSRTLVPYAKGIRVLTRLSSLLDPDDYVEGSWYGNDTLWRTVLDLNRMLLYADAKGALTSSVQRRVLNVVDAVLAGEGEGPMETDPVECNLIAAGRNSLALDTVLARAVGFDHRKIPLIQNGWGVNSLPLASFTPSQIEVLTVGHNFSFVEPAGADACASPFRFRPPSGWAGHIEL